MESSTDSGLSLSNDLHSPWIGSNRRGLSPTRITLFNDSHSIKTPQNGADKTKRYSTAFENVLSDSEGKKQTKRVEFCKTEIHFAPDSGRVNIVETDEKPIPSSSFRRRRRSTNNSICTTSFSEDRIQLPLVECEKAKVNVFTETLSVADPVSESTESIEERRGILKNKPVIPKKYHLGENICDSDTFWEYKKKPYFDDVEKPQPSAYARLREEREEVFEPNRRDFGYSTKVILTRQSPISSVSVDNRKYIPTLVDFSLSHKCNEN